VYAMGIVMHELLTHREPWKGATISTVIHNVAAGERPVVPAPLEAAAPMGWAKLMRACWSQDPSHRPAFQQMFELLDGMVPNSDSSRQGTQHQTSRTREFVAEGGGAPGPHLSGMHVELDSYVIDRI